MKIRSFKVRAVKIPLPEPHHTASGCVVESPLVLVDALIDNGIIGHSLMFTYTAAALKPAAELVSNIGSLLGGATLAPVRIKSELESRFRLLGTQGLVGMALATIDMALWDALARSMDTSVIRLLGAENRAIPAYGAVGYDGAVGSAMAAAEWVDRGFLGVKAKIGYPTLQEDIAVIRSIRKAVGDGIAVMVDYNQSLDPIEAIRRLRALDGEELEWVEEPVLAHDFSGHALVATASRTPIQCGENWWGTLDTRHALDVDASDLVMFDVMKIGGVTGWMHSTALAASRGKRISSHLWPELSAQLLSWSSNGHWLEYTDWWNPVLAQPLVIKSGMTDVGHLSGSGIAWDEDAVAHYGVL